MNKKINSAQLQEEINNLLKDYEEEIIIIFDDELNKAGNEAKKKLSSKNEGAFMDRTGKYRKGWRKKLEKKRLNSSVIVYNASAPGLTHLLEFGHVKQNGGRTRAFPHIAPVNDEIQENLINQLKARISKAE